jgi:single-strand DNA-binding protein
MTDSINKVILLGNVAAAPAFVSFNDGGRACQLRIVTAEADGDSVTTEWHTIMVESANLVDLAERALRKGSKVHVEGRLRTHKAPGVDGQTAYTSVVVLKGPAAALIPFEAAPEQATSEGAGLPGGAAPAVGSSHHHFHHDLADGIDDDNIPF